MPRDAYEIALAAAGFNRVPDAHAVRPDPGEDRGHPARSAALQALLAEAGRLAVLVSSRVALVRDLPDGGGAILEIVLQV